MSGCFLNYDQEIGGRLLFTLCYRPISTCILYISEMSEKEKITSDKIKYITKCLHIRSGQVRSGQSV